MSLTDRIAAAQRPAVGHGARTRRLQPASHRSSPRRPAAPAARSRASPRPPPLRQPPSLATRGSALAEADGQGGTAGRDPFGDVKRIVHARLVETLGPKLYDAHMTQSELEQQVHFALQTALAETDQPMS